MTPEQKEELEIEKSVAIFFAIEELEGRVLTAGEIAQFIRIEVKAERPGEELIRWRLKPILHFKWNKKGELKTLKLYGKKKT